MFKIDDGREHFFQWDLNRRLLIEDDSITNIHFCNKTDDCALNVEVYKDGGKRYANVPNILLQDAWSIRAYAYCGECYTKQKAVYKVEARSKPANYVYTETEVKTWERLAADIEELVTEGREIINEAQEVAERTTELVNNIDNNIANALKGNKRGNPIALNGVSPIEHDIACKVERKNLFPNFITDKTCPKGSFVKVNEDGSITIHKVAGDTINETITLPLNAGVYNLSNGYGANRDVWIQVTDMAVSTYYGTTISYGVATITLPKDDTYKITLYTNTAYEIDSITFYPQLEKGTVATSYVPYIESVEGLKVKAYGKNILSDAVYDINNWVRNDGISINSTYSKVYYLDEIPNGTYTISAKANKTGVYLYFYYSKDGGATWEECKGASRTNYIIASENAYTITFEKTDNTRFLFWLNDINTLNKIDYIQIEAGATATAYEPYKAPIIYTTEADGNASILSTIDNMTLSADAGAIMNVKYNRDINKAYTELVNAIISLGGNV